MNQSPPFKDRRSKLRWNASGSAPVVQPPRSTVRSSPESLDGDAPQFVRAPLETSLTPQAHLWLQELPPHYQPLSTARRHPHIVNRLSAIWQISHERSAYLNDLLTIRRQSRGGFSLGVLTELTDLCAWLEKTCLSAAAATSALNDQQQFVDQKKQKNPVSGERFVDQRR